MKGKPADKTEPGHRQRIQEAQGGWSPVRKKIMKSFDVKVAVNRGNYCRDIL